MAASDPERPTLLHRVEFEAFRLVETIVGWLPMDSCASLGRHAGRLFQFLSPRYRKIVRRNLRIATAKDTPSPEAIDQLVNETFRRAGANFISSLKSATMSAEELAQYIETIGGEILVREPSGTGLVVAMPHMGNWEVMAKLSSLDARIGRFGGVYRPLDNPLMDELTHRRRTADGCQLFSRRDGFHAPIALLRSPGPLGVLADLRAGGHGVVLPFFGKLTSCSPLPDLMARRAKAEVATLSIVTIADGRWKANFHPLGKSPGVAGIMKALEEAMGAGLADVFWFHDRWRIDRTRPLSFYTKYDRQVANEATVPMRVLLTFPDDQPEAAEILIRGLLDERPDLRIDWLTAIPGEPVDPRVVKHDWDHSEPDEHADGTLDRIDATHPAPLDAALLFGGTPVLAHAAKRAGLRSIIGCRVSGKPWTKSFDEPSEAGAWRQVAADLAYVPKSHEP
ncbi:MAG: lysophospholipid acyltransferase family protein [Verrucomicrobiota bacterium]